jgi:hypothetical protein
MHITASALDFIQRIVEYFNCGKVLQTFEIRRAKFDIPICCYVLIGHVHGTTFFRLEHSRGQNALNLESDGDSDENEAWVGECRWCLNVQCFRDKEAHLRPKISKQRETPETSIGI